MQTFIKGLGAFLYSFVQAILIDLFVFALMYCLAKLFIWLIPHISFWVLFIIIPIILIILSILWWAITFFTSITSMPYAKLRPDGNPFKVFTLPIVILALNAIVFCYREWTFTGIDAPQSYFITYNVIATILIVIITFFSMAFMFSDE